jgi:predicted DsbA family dithiol-disulfide isomerase
MNQRVSEMGESAGIHFEFDSIKLGNTFNAHKLLQFSKQMGKGQETKDRLLKAYFEEGVSVSSLENLSSIAEEIGLSAEETNNAFTNTLFADKVKTDIHEAQTLGISGVPFFVFNNKYAVSGAQPVSVFREVLETVMNEKNDFHEQSMQGETCSPGEEC